MNWSISQFGIFLLGDGDEGDGLIGGDLGTSWVTGSSVNQEIRQFLPVTLELITLSFLVAVGLGAGGRRVDQEDARRL